MPRYSTFLPTWLLLTLLLSPSLVVGQVPAADSSIRAGTDSQPAPADSASKADTIQASSDTVRTPRHAQDTAADTATSSAQPGDSVLSTACHGPAGPGAVARDLLMIVFAPQAGAEERVAAARSVGGSLLGPVTSGEPGAYYLRVPSGGEEYRLRVAADQLIQLDMVRQVGSRACPPLPR